MTSDVQNFISLFLNDLTEKTQKNLVEWHRLCEYESLSLLNEQLPETPGLYIDFYTNSVKVGKSYYVENKKGTLFLLYIWHASEQLDGEYFMLARLRNRKELIYFDFGEGFHKYTKQNLDFLADSIESNWDESQDPWKEFYEFLEEILE